LSVPPCSRLPDLPLTARFRLSPRLPLGSVRLSGRFERSLGLRGIGFGFRISDFGMRRMRFRSLEGGSPEILRSLGKFLRERKGHSARYRGRDQECRIRNRARVVKRLSAGIGLSVPPCSRLPDLPRAARSWSSPRLPPRPVRLSGRFERRIGLRGIGFGSSECGASGAEDGDSGIRGGSPGFLRCLGKRPPRT